jgi:acyl-CoA thioester hydrolase
VHNITDKEVPTTDLSIRVSYGETDQMKMVYYANYLIYFERGRTEWLRQHGFCYKDMEAQGLYLPVIDCSCKYLAPAHYDDVLIVRTRLAERGAASLTFSYEITCNGCLLVRGSTRHPIVDTTFKPIRFPAELRKIFDEAYEKENTDC